MATINDVASLQNVEGLGIKTTSDTQYTYSPLTPTSLIGDLPNDSKRSESNSSTTAARLEEEDALRQLQQLSSDRVITPNAQNDAVYQLGNEGSALDEFGLPADIISYGSYRQQQPRASTPTPAGSSNVSVPEPPPKDKRERNRKAARKCRQKAKGNTEWLKERDRELSRENKELKYIAGGLRDEVLCLKNELLTHSQYCDSEPIKSYLAKVAGDLVNKNLN